MAVYVSGLNSRVMGNVNSSDEVIIISGFLSLNIIEEIAKQGIPTTIYYGMYLRNGISSAYYSKFKNLESTYPKLKIYIPVQYHVHTKCYIFRNSNHTKTVLVGSANCSSSALLAPDNSELLTPITDTDNPADIAFIDNYAKDIASVSVHFDDPIIVINKKGKTLRPKAKGTPASWNQYTGNPFSAIIPLYYIDKTTQQPVVHKKDGLNWGNGPHASKSNEMESVIPIRKFQVNNYPLLIPFNGAVGSGSGGKIQRMQNPIEMTWDDGCKMKMLFQQGGVQVPPPSKCTPGVAYRQYPKALTANSGGSELGAYIRNRMGLPVDHEITYNDLEKYKRDYITLTLTNAGDYELDFSV